MIELKNIDLSKVSIRGQFKKVIEEHEELIDALDDYYETQDIKEKEHVIEEYWDVVQSYLGVLSKYNITAKEVMEYYPKHLEKIKNRPR